MILIAVLDICAMIHTFLPPTTCGSIPPLVCKAVGTVVDLMCSVFWWQHYYQKTVRPGLNFLHAPVLRFASRKIKDTV